MQLGAFMPWIFGLVGLLVGAILGIIISRIKTPQYKKQQLMKRELEATKFELEQQRQELTDHFSKTKELMDVLGKDYAKLYQHMSSSSSELLSSTLEQEQPFSTKPEEKKELENKEAEPEAEMPPRDYADGASGILTPETKEKVDTEEAIKNAS